MKLIQSSRHELITGPCNPYKWMIDNKKSRVSRTNFLNMTYIYIHIDETRGTILFRFQQTQSHQSAQKEFQFLGHSPYKFHLWVRNQRKIAPIGPQPHLLQQLRLVVENKITGRMHHSTLFSHIHANWERKKGSSRSSIEQECSFEIVKKSKKENREYTVGGEVWEAPSNLGEREWSRNTSVLKLIHPTYKSRTLYRFVADSSQMTSNTFNLRAFKTESGVEAT
jgi:hypothetical protein